MNEFFNKHGIKIVLAFLILMYFKSCSLDNELAATKTELNAIKQEQVNTQAELDTVTTKIISKQELEQIIKAVPAWETLRIEEISDKENISINALRQKEK